MKGVKTERKHDMYFHEFTDYVSLLRYMDNKRPAQIAIVYHDDTGLITGSEPVQAHSVRREPDATA